MVSQTAAKEPSVESQPHPRLTSTVMLATDSLPLASLAVAMIVCGPGVSLVVSHVIVSELASMAPEAM